MSLLAYCSYLGSQRDSFKAQVRFPSFSLFPLASNQLAILGPLRMSVCFAGLTNLIYAVTAYSILVMLASITTIALNPSILEAKAG